LWFALGQTEKNSMRANVFGFAPESGLPSMLPALRFRARRRLMHRSNYRRYSITSSAIRMYLR